MYKAGRGEQPGVRPPGAYKITERVTLDWSPPDFGRNIFKLLHSCVNYVRIVTLWASRRRLLVFSIAYLVYWAMYPAMFRRFDVEYSLVLLLFIIAAALMWGVLGGAISVLITAPLRYWVTIAMGAEFTGGLFFPALIMITAVLIGAMSEYIRDIEMQLDRLKKNQSRNVEAQNHSRNALIDFFIVMTVSLAIMFLAARLDLFERMQTFMSASEKYEFDELVILALVLALGLAVFAYRRWRELRREYFSHIRTMSALTESERKYSAIVNDAGEGICVIQQGAFRYMNPFGLKILQFKAEDLPGKPFLDLVHPEDRDLPEVRQYSAQDPRLKKLLFRAVAGNGRVLWLRVSGEQIEWDGRPATLNIFRDVSDLVLSEQKLKEALNEKEALLREIHHRVKNNMQVIISLLNLQKNRSVNPVLDGAFDDATTRIRAMSAAHETLYQSESLSSINLAVYLEKLVRGLISSHALPTQVIKIDFNFQDIFLELSQAVPCGLAVNELAVNAVKHGLVGRDHGEIKVSAIQDSQRTVRVTLCDDGPGLPAGYDWKNPDTLGLTIVRLLVEDQLEGDLECRHDQGLCFQITFQPDPVEQLDSDALPEEN